MMATVVQAVLATESDDDAMKWRQWWCVMIDPTRQIVPFAKGSASFLCRGGRISAEADGHHIICQSCCTSWFTAQRELRAEANVAPKLRPECPVCKCALRSCSTRGDASCFMGLERIADDNKPETTTSSAFTFGDVPPAAVKRCVAVAIRGVLGSVPTPRAALPGTAAASSSKRKQGPSRLPSSRSQRRGQCDGPHASAASSCCPHIEDDEAEDEASMPLVSAVPVGPIERGRGPKTCPRPEDLAAQGGRLTPWQIRAARNDEVLVDMGFTELSATRALAACDNDVQRSVAFLIEHGRVAEDEEARPAASAAAQQAREAAAQQAREAAAAEGLQLVAANNATGFKYVSRTQSRFTLKLSVGDREQHLGTFDNGRGGRPLLCAAHGPEERGGDRSSGDDG
jgi:hypothetical protein